jgi:hypothetical protein
MRELGHQGGAGGEPQASGILRFAGGLVALTVGAVGVLATLVVAAVLAVFTVLASLLLATAGLAWRMGRRQPRASEPLLIDARKVGHAWVAYGWDEPRR